MPWNKGKKMSKEFREKCRARQIGKTHSNETKDRMSKAQKGIPKNHSKEGLERIGKAHRGERSHWWEGGKTSERGKIYNSYKYRNWRRCVFERDSYTCQECGQHGGALQADHIKPFALFPELRFELSNGRTLCKTCHRKTDTFGSKCKRPKAQVEHKLSPQSDSESSAISDRI